MQEAALGRIYTSPRHSWRRLRPFHSSIDVSKAIYLLVTAQPKLNGKAGTASTILWYSRYHPSRSLRELDLVIMGCVVAITRLWQVPYRCTERYLTFVYCGKR